MTTGGRGSESVVCALRALQVLLDLVLLEDLGVWPISSTTSTAVSWSIGWLMVAMTPMFIRTLMTSVALTAIFCASSATLTVSPMPTSRTTGAVGISNPWRPSLPLGRARDLTRRFFL